MAPITIQTWRAAASIGVFLAWVAFTAVFVTRRRPPRAPETRRDPASILGIVLQALGFVAASLFRRTSAEPLVPMPMAAEIALLLAAVALAFLSVYTVQRAVRTLGKQWSLRARLVEGHTLVIGGPYRWVRHPIYSAMLGMLIASAVVGSRWQMILLGLPLFAVGTAIRIQSEEGLLRGSFPEEYARYAARVKAVIPGVL